MIAHNDILDMVIPIRQYIEVNEVHRSDAHIVVLNFFPSDETVTAISKWLCESLPEFERLGSDKAVRRTRQILTSMLEEEARAIIGAKQYPTPAQLDDDLFWDTLDDNHWDEIQYEN